MERDEAAVRGAGEELRSLGELLAPKLERLRPRLHPAVATALRRAVSAAHTRLQQPHRLRLSRGALPATSAAAGAAAGGGEPAEADASESEAGCALLRAAVERRLGLG